MFRKHALLLICIGCTDNLTAPDGGPDGSSDASLDEHSVDVMSDLSTDVTFEPDADAGFVWNDLADTSKWTPYNLPTGTEAFAGAVFDGHYLYLVPAASNVIARYDTTMSFTASGAWTTYTLAGFAGFSGAAFDGKYIYFAPHDGGSVVPRYDTTASFTSSTSYESSVDTKTVSGGSGSFYYNGAAYDGKQYVYFFPYECCGSVIEGTIIRYDTKASFVAAGGWSASGNDTGINPNAKGFQGGAFDGRYVYAVPFAYSSPTGWNGVVTRYDSQGSFVSDSSWSAFDLTNKDGAAKGFIGAVFDGQYMYFVPGFNGAADGVVAQLDTLGNFSTSWSTYDIASQVNAAAVGFAGGAYDGRHVYLVPNTGSTIARFDTLAQSDAGQGAFTTPSSWRTFDTTKVNGGAKQFFSGAFDGQYVYFVPNANGVIVRFEARSSPGPIPSFVHGSFY